MISPISLFDRAESGIYMAEKHIDLLKKLRDESGASKIKVHMLGHR